MFVQDKTYFHIHRLGTKYDNLWTVGSYFEVGREENLFLDYYKNVRIGINYGEGQTIPILGAYALIKHMDGSDGENAKKVWMQQACKAIKEMSILIRETLFEEYRIKNFSEKPSRKNCIWLTEKEALKTWLPKILNGKEKGIICRLSVTGDVHTGSGRFLINDCISQNELRNNASGLYCSPFVKLHLTV